MMRSGGGGRLVRREAGGENYYIVTCGRDLFKNGFTVVVPESGATHLTM